MEHAIECHRGAVIRLALAQTRDASDAQDVAQEVFIKLLRSQARFNDDDHLRAWLLRATHDVCVDFHRQAWRRRVETRDDMSLIAEAANIMGCTEASARTRLHRGRKRLAEELERLNRSEASAAQAVNNDGNAGSTPAHAQ